MWWDKVILSENLILFKEVFWIYSGIPEAGFGKKVVIRQGRAVNGTVGEHSLKNCYVKYVLIVNII